DASDELSKLLNLELEDVFNYSKPTSLIKYLISFIKKEFINATILDFFAGFYVIIMLVVKSLIKSRVLVILQNIKTQVSNNLCVV
ncbi:hypothetical protein, partial [Gemella sp. zg-1178]